MIDIDYRINETFGCYDNYITVGGFGYDKLKDYEQDTFICDCLTHEYIHALLEDIFNITTSQLFDFIGDSLLNKKILKQGVCLSCSDILWSDAIALEGNKWLYNEYMIDNIRLIQSYLLCNFRSV